MFQDMYRLNRPRPDIVFRRSGQIDIRLEASRRMCLTPGSRVSFFLDGEGDLYVRRDADGLRPVEMGGKHSFRFHCKQVTDAVLCLPDVPSGLDRAAFRIGQPDDGANFPVITRRLL